MSDEPSNPARHGTLFAGWRMTEVTIPERPREWRVGITRLRLAIAWVMLAALIGVGAWCIRELYKAEMALRADRWSGREPFH